MSPQPIKTQISCYPSITSVAVIVAIIMSALLLLTIIENSNLKEEIKQCKHDLENPPWDWKTATTACGVCSTISTFIPGGSAVNVAMKFVHN